MNALMLWHLGGGIGIGFGVLQNVRCERRCQGFFFSWAFHFFSISLHVVGPFFVCLVLGSEVIVGHSSSVC